MSSTDGAEAERPEASSGGARSILKGMFSSGAGIFLSRITGLLRDVVSAAYWGATGSAQAAYNVAFSVPNGLRMLLGERNVALKY